MLAFIAFLLFFPDAIKRGMLPIVERRPMPPKTAPVAASSKVEFLLSPIRKPRPINAVPPPNKTHAAVFDFYFFSGNQFLQPVYHWGLTGRKWLQELSTVMYKESSFS